MSEFRGRSSFLNEDVWLQLCSLRLFTETSEAKTHSINSKLELTEGQQQLCCVATCEVQHFGFSQTRPYLLGI